MRDLMAMSVVIGLVALSLRSASAAYTAWAWTSVAAFNVYMYGFMQSVPVNQIVALISIGLIVAKKDAQRGPFEFNRSMVLFALFFVQATLSAAFAYDGLAANVDTYSNLFKALLFCVFMPMVLTTRARIHAVMLVMALGLSFHGLLDGLKFLASGGGHRAQGFSKFGDNNHLAVALAMSVPWLLYLTQYSANRWIRWGFLGALFANVLGVIATHSRGGLLALMALATGSAMNSRRKFLNLGIIVLAVVAVLLLAPDSWSERMSSIKEAGTDDSFMSRVLSWKRSSAIALENPLLGGGFSAVQSSAIYWKFANSEGFLGFLATPPPSGIPYASHSIYFQVLGDMGFLGFFLFMAILANAFILRREIKHMVKAAGPSLNWAGDLADVLGVSMLAYVVGGAGVSLAYLEVVYAVVMLLEVLKRQVRIEAAKPSGAESA